MLKDSHGGNGTHHDENWQKPIEDGERTRPLRYDGGYDAHDRQGHRQGDGPEDEAGDEDTPAEAMVVGEPPLPELLERGPRCRRRERIQPGLDEGIGRGRRPGRR
jgi:hypothetical protein